MALIERDMVVNDVITKYPDAVQVMERFGFHCFGCGFNALETIEEGARGHGMEDDAVANLLKELNEVAAKPQEKKEGIVLTHDAAAKIAELHQKAGKEKEGLRIKVQPGGCAGLSYDFTFDNKAEQDTVISKDNVDVFVDKESVQFLQGATINYVETLQKSGFVIDNPNATSTCGCGQSFG